MVTEKSSSLVINEGNYAVYTIWQENHLQAFNFLIKSKYSVIT